jgi:hypothetical protein
LSIPPASAKRNGITDRNCKAVARGLKSED